MFRLAREIELLSYVPDYFREFLEMRVIQECIQPDGQGLVDEIERILKNQFILEADEAGIRMYENMLQIQPLSSDSLENRRFRVLSKWNQYAPYTRITLRKKLATLCGEDGYTVEITEDKRLIVRVELKSKSNYSEVKKLLEEIVPCNMVIDLDLLYNQYLALGKFTHRQLAAWTHEYIRNEVLLNGNGNDKL